MNERLPFALPRRILLPVIGIRDAQSLLPTAQALLDAGSQQVIMAGLVGVRHDLPLSKGAYRARRRRQDLAALAETLPEAAYTVDPQVRVSYDPLSDLMALVEEHACDAVLARIMPDGKRALGIALDEMLSRLSGYIILQRGALPASPRQVLLASQGGKHIPHAAGIAMALCQKSGAALNLLEVTSPRSASLTPRQPDAIHVELSHMTPFVREINLQGSLVDVVEVIQREMQGHDSLVLGTRARTSGQAGVDLRTKAILDAFDKPALVVYAPVEHRPSVTRRSVLPLSLSVDKWFAENTFDADEFSDLERLVALKQAQGVTISLGLPALNEEDTVGKVIATLRDELVNRHPLLDEIVLIDSMSTDRTVEIAEAAGVPVYRHPEILPEMGTTTGKGEALWKSLYVLKGDIIAWIDTDIVNIHPRFVYGLLGPLLVSPAVKYVKGFYRRPLRVEGKLQAGGGGRVTELVARPMLNLFFPKLSGIIQPLSGEYAGRREVLERVPFFSGYAVEIGLLIDILTQFGLEAIAQVDLKQRVHHNQPLVALSKMSSVIIQAIFERLDEHQIIDLLDEPSRSMKLVSDDEGRFYLDIEELVNIERPPMATVAAYRKRHGVARQV